jgi:hypothetical protein
MSKLFISYARHNLKSMPLKVRKDSFPCVLKIGKFSALDFYDVLDFSAIDCRYISFPSFLTVKVFHYDYENR